jgi:hypothetical protein
MNTNDDLKEVRMSDKTFPHPHPQPRTPNVSSVPPTPAEAAASSVRWERHGLLGRLVQAR